MDSTISAAPPYERGCNRSPLSRHYGRRLAAVAHAAAMPMMTVAAAHHAAMPAVMVVLYELRGPLVLKKLERRPRGRGLGGSDRSAATESGGGQLRRETSSSCHPAWVGPRMICRGVMNLGRIGLP